MPSNGLVLIGSSQQLNQEIQTFLAGFGQAPAPCYSFDSARQQLGSFSQQLLLCLAGSAADLEEIASLIRVIRQRVWPRAILLVETEAARNARRAPAMDTFALRLAWPAQAPTLQGLIQGPQRQNVAARPSLSGNKPKGPSLTEQAGQELLALTPSLTGLVEPLAVAVSHDVTVLLTGETGTGKTRLARLIHEHSPRKHQPLLVIPCGALSTNLVESELFGHAKGAFTGADRAKVGKFEAVGEGTILLDEIDTLGLEQQAKLLRVIETGAYEPVGSNQTLHCRARIIAASNWDLEEAVAQNKFRQDLYYRLNVLALYLPPLRARVPDIAPLARSIVARFSARLNKAAVDLTDEALAALAAFPWPGNIRQLENVVQQAVLMCNGPELLLRHLPQRVRDFTPPEPVQPMGQPNGCVAVGMPLSATQADVIIDANEAGWSLAEKRASQERVLIERALAAANNCRSQAARALKVSRVTLYNKMRKYGLDGGRLDQGPDAEDVG